MLTAYSTLTTYTSPQCCTDTQIHWLSNAEENELTSVKHFWEKVIPYLDETDRYVTQEQCRAACVQMITKGRRRAAALLHKGKQQPFCPMQQAKTPSMEVVIRGGVGLEQIFSLISYILHVTEF